MRILVVLLLFQIFSENWKCLLLQSKPEFDNTSCDINNDCTRNRLDGDHRCSVCATDEAKKGGRYCLSTFLKEGWFRSQCGINPNCELKCGKNNKCIFKDKQFVQTCFCAKGRCGKSCETRVDSVGYCMRMVQWNRKNVFAKPGELTRFHYRCVGDSHNFAKSAYAMFIITGFGYTVNLRRHKEAPSKKCKDEKDTWCTDNYVSLKFPYLAPENNFGVTVLRRSNQVVGYLTSIEGRFKTNAAKKFAKYNYNVFVSYEQGTVLKCIPVIQLLNCARTSDKALHNSFYHNELITINYDIKYLEDGAYLSTSKENRKKCSAEGTIWTWTWAKVQISDGFEEEKEHYTQIGAILKFEPNTLTYGFYRINISIKRVDDAAKNENYDQCYFMVKPLPLRAVIDGGEIRKVVKDAGFTLSARDSSDPNLRKKDQSSLLILWTCTCLTTHIPNCEQTCMFNKKQPYKWMKVYEQLYVNPHELQYNAEYLFKVMVDTSIKYPEYFNDVAPKYAYVTITVANETEKAVINYYIECTYNCIRDMTLPNEVLFLKVKVSGNGVSGKEVLKKLCWSYMKKNDSVLHTMDSMKLKDLPDSMIAIKEGSLEQGIVYTTLLTDCKSQELLSKYTFRTTSAKYEGNCTVEPQSGIKGLTVFDIKCVSADNFIFEFYDKSKHDLSENIVFNGRMLGTSEFLGLLEDVRLTRGNIVIYVIQKASGLYVKQVINIELLPCQVTIEEIKGNLTSIVGLNNLKTTMEYISFVPDILHEQSDKSEMLQLLLETISQACPLTIWDVKLISSTMNNVLQTLNKPTTISINLVLAWKTLASINKLASKVRRAVVTREVSQWIPSQEIKQIATTILICLNIAMKCGDASRGALSSENMNFDTLFLLREEAKEIQKALDKLKDILCYIHSPGLPPATLATPDGNFKIWAMGNDRRNTVSKMLKKDKNIPFLVSKYFLNTYSKGNKYGIDLFFQAATINRNVFSWSKSDVRSELVSVSVALRKTGKYLKQISLLTSPILIRIGMEKNLTNTTVAGSVLQLDPHLNQEDLDVRLTVHRIDTPPKGFVTIRFLYPPTTDSLRVILMEEFRPDYDLITKSKETVVINSSNPEVPVQHRSVIDLEFLYMGILPDAKVPVNQTVAYKFQVTLTLCQLWVESQWTSIGCEVSPRTTSKETLCSCNHLSIFAAAFLVPPESIDPFGDAKLFLTVLENPVVVVFVIILFIIYLLLVVWGGYKDKADQYKGKVIMLEDNFPDDPYYYLLAVHTSARFNAGTTANVGIQLIGKDSRSRAHILSCKKRRVLKRNSDDWFLICSPKPLGDVYAIQLWHDNTGSNPEWYCDKIIVYDLRDSTEAVFIVEQWLALREGDFPEAIIVIASKYDLLNIKRMFLDNVVIGFRDSHTILSVFVRHPRSEVTRVQRVSILMCFIMVAMLCSIMYYRPKDSDHPNDDYQYDVGTRELLISIQSLLITMALTMIVLLSFERSYKVTHRRRHTSLQFRKDKFAESLSQDPRFSQIWHHGRDKSLYENYVHYVSKYLTKPSLAPVSIIEGTKIVELRKIWYSIAWLSCIVVVLGSAYLVMLYGLKLGFVQSQKWLTSLLMTMGEDSFVMGPARIIAIAILLSIACQISTKVDLHVIDVRDIIEAKLVKEVTDADSLMRKRNHPMYLPLSESARLELLKEKEIRRKWWCLVDFMSAACCVLAVNLAIYRWWPSHFHSAHHLIKEFSETHRENFGAVDIKKVADIWLVESYFEVALIETLFNLLWYNGDPMTTLTVEPEGIHRYWAQDSIHKMICKPRVRQVRVVPRDCRNVYFSTMRKCLFKWSLHNEDTNIYGENWAPATYFDTTKEDSPWEFKNRQTMLWWTHNRFYGYYGDLYDISGYFTSVGPTVTDVLMALEELKKNNWQDWYTRGCFLTATVYNVNTQVFSQVSVLFEYFVDGSMASTVTVTSVSRNIQFGVWELFFILCAIYAIFRCAYLINRTGLMDYLKTISNSTRIVVVLLMFLAIILWCVHHHKSILFVEGYMEHQSDDYFDFDKFISIFNLLQVVLTLLLCVTITRSFILLHGGRRFLNIYYALTISFTCLCWLALSFLLLLHVMALLTYFLHCQNYLKVKELILPYKITGYLKTSFLEHRNVQLLIFLQVAVLYFIRMFFLVFLYYYIKIARAHNLKDSDSFNLVIFFVERVKACFRRSKYSI